MFRTHINRSFRSRRGRAAWAGSVALCTLITASGCTGAAPPTHDASLQSVRRAAAAPSLVCKDAISWDRKPISGFTVLFNRAGLPIHYAFGAVKTRGGNPARPYFAKQGLLVKTNTTFDLIVPTAWRSRLRIGWGNPGPEATHLHVGPCGPTKASRPWLGYAGGYTLDKPACVPLIVKTATAQKTVHIGAGKACPGQAQAPAPH